jgi:hypothetical protein
MAFRRAEGSTLCAIDQADVTRGRECELLTLDHSPEAATEDIHDMSVL